MPAAAAEKEQGVTLETWNAEGDEIKAVITHGVWTSDDSLVEEYLNVLRLPIGSYYPDRDLSLAEQAQKHLGGEIIDHRDLKGAPPPGGTDGSSDNAVEGYEDAAQDFGKLAKYSPEQERVPKGSPDGGRWTKGDAGLAAHQYWAKTDGRSVNIKKEKATDRVWTGKQVEQKVQLKKDQTGKVGEAVAIAYLKQQGYTGAKTAVTSRNNGAIDIRYDHVLGEVKAGNASNGSTAQHWRVTLGQFSKTEQRFYNRLSALKKADHNEDKMKAAMGRKEAMRSELSKKLGKPIKAQTFTFIVDGDRQRVDMFRFEGYHRRIAWKDAEVASHYIGTYSYHMVHGSVRVGKAYEEDELPGVFQKNAPPPDIEASEWRKGLPEHFFEAEGVPDDVRDDVERGIDSDLDDLYLSSLAYFRAEDSGTLSESEGSDAHGPSYANSVSGDDDEAYEAQGGDDAEKLAKYSPDQPREPAGSSAGGQFASAPDQGYTSDPAGGKKKIPVHSLEEARRMRDAGWHFSQASLYAVTDRTHPNHPHLHYIDHGKPMGVTPWIAKPPQNKAAEGEFAKAASERRVRAEARARMERTIHDFFRRTAEKFYQILIAPPPEPEKAQKDDKKKKPIADPQAVIDKLKPDWSELGHSLTPDFEYIAVDAGNASVAGVGVHSDEVLSEVNHVAGDWAKDRAAELVGMRRLEDGTLVENPSAKYSISETTRDDLREIVTDAFEHGATIQELAERIRDAGAFSETRAATIAATEAARSEEYGNLTGWRESGQVDSVEVVLSADHDLDDECDEAADGSPYEIDDPDLPDLPIHPNCRCSYRIGSLAGETEEL
jgi:SPP1 gp7 family putative phage head morphogenesis protein